MQSYFYQDKENMVIHESLLTEKAKEWAVSFIKPKQPQQRYMRNPELTSAQLRKFHIEAKALEERCKNLSDPAKEFERIRPLVKMLKSKVAYACPISGRDRKIPVEFREYIETMVDNIDDFTDFKAFALCFEAVVGFFYGQGGRP